MVFTLSRQGADFEKRSQDDPDKYLSYRTLITVATYHHQFVTIRHTIPSSLGKETCSERHDKVARGMISLVKEHTLRGKIEEALAQFSKDPLSEESRKAGALIVSYAEASEIVSIVISPETLPMLASEDEVLGEKHGTQMLMAYIAGCVRAQLKNGAVDSYPGVVEQLKVYKLLRKKWRGRTAA